MIDAAAEIRESALLGKAENFREVRKPFAHPR
jgi:hypothetical protein